MFFLAIFAFILIIVLLQIWGSKDRAAKLIPSPLSMSSRDKEEFRQRWSEIKKLAQLPGESRSTQALLKADQLLDFVLSKKGLNEGSLGEKLKQAQKFFRQRENYQRAWDVHKLRNTVVHQADFVLTKAALRGALQDLEAVWQDLDLF